MSKKQNSGKPSLERILELQRFLTNFHHIERVVHINEHSDRLESDTEHTYMLAMVAWFLVQHFPDLDLAKVLQYALAHDLVEIYAGDTYVFADPELLASKQQREADALERIKKEWPDFADLTQAITDYENLADKEARFVYALDKLMPAMAIFIAGGKTWRLEDITIEKLDAAKREKVSVSPEINEYMDPLIDLLKANRHLFNK